ncbi:MAG TPA: hypothetical protein VMV56_07390 [Williamwhitmania sp.]|nr:hypothetical protein [Williamwhitmania sp.]
MTNELNNDRDFLRKMLHDGVLPAPDGFSEMVKARVGEVEQAPSKVFFSDWLHVTALYPILLAIAGIVAASLQVATLVFPRLNIPMMGVVKLFQEMLTNQTFLLIIATTLALWLLDHLLERYAQRRQAQLS